MHPLQFIIPLDALAAVAPILAYVTLGLALLNLVTRIVQHRFHLQQAKASTDDEGLNRWLPHTATTVGLVLVSFLYMIPHPHAGMVMSVLALGVLFADFFEYESRLVEARSKSKQLSRPIAAVGASAFMFLYAAYQSVFFVIEPVWNSIV